MSLLASGVVDEEPTIDLGRLRAQTAFEQIVAFRTGALDDRFRDASLERAVLLARDRLLEGEQEFLAPLFLFRGDGISQGLGARSRFGRIGEGPDIVELCPAHELAELLELALPFARKSDDEGRSDRDVRH